MQKISIIPNEAQRKFRGEGEGDVKKEAISEGVGGSYRGLFPGGLIKIGELIINSSFSVEKAISYFTVTSVSKQVLLFALIMFYLRSAKCFFQWFQPRFQSVPKETRISVVRVDTFRLG